ncbi:U-scoloptoxin(05)-Er1a-like [Stegodyphus dumicola]|uniref:U-scoloptoxin(05)-Er1a-like n=1 Tax=Stegodyphus dumicola TaxID=202533 RepID=UPI0015B26162|nr:U-scoloptoxin(05)-Er1a-like [Stegodyphus dumicola]
MKISVGIILLSSIVNTVSGIECFQCNSTYTLDCLEKFIQPNFLKSQPCSDVFEARYCIKTTGIYQSEVGTQRFCSSRDLGNYCESIHHEGDNREYRSCVYTCSTDACNAAVSVGLFPHLLPKLAIIIGTVGGFIAKFQIFQLLQM